MFHWLRNFFSHESAARGAASLETIETVETRDGPIRFICSSATTRWRAETALTKEPDTIEWIDSFEPNESLWDVGANVGVYTMYAARRGINVSAFEPSPANFYALTRNVRANGFDDLVSPFCLAFDSETHVDAFYQVSEEVGSALHQFGQRVDWQGNPLDPNKTQRVAMLGFSIDDFVQTFHQEVPTHLKIDVDGIEQRVIAGARQTLSDLRLKSLLIELDAGQESYQAMVDTIESCGMRLHKRARDPGTSKEEFANVINHIFLRKSKS